MRFRIACVLTIATIALSASAARGQTTRPATQPAGASKGSAEDPVAVTVNGHAIRESDFDEVFKHMVLARMQGQKVSKQDEARQRQSLRRPLLEVLVAQALFAPDIEQAGIEITDKELAKELDAFTVGQLVKRGITREEYEAQILTRYGRPLKVLMEEQVANPMYRFSVLQMKVLRKKFAEEAAVTDDEVKTKYEQGLSTIYTKQERVKASHILIKTSTSMSPEDKAAARKKLEDVLVEARKPDADFAALARVHSEGPSGPKGGDLGFFPRKGQGSMVEPFAAAAFAVKEGEVTDIVETQYGYHIIKVTGKMPGSTVTLEQAKDVIREELVQAKLTEVRRRRLDELKKAATIVYAEDGPSSPVPTPPATTQRAATPPGGGRSAQPTTQRSGTPKSTQPSTGRATTQPAREP